MDIELLFWAFVYIVVIVGAFLSLIFPNKLKIEK